MASNSVFAAVLLLALSLPFVLAGNAAGAEQSSQSKYEYDANGNIILSPAGNNNQNGNGQGTSADVIDWYNDQEYPTCPLKACPPFKHYCSGGMCNDTAGILGRWRLPEQSSRVCPPGRANPKPNNEWCIGELTPSQCCKACSDSKEPCAVWQHYIGTVNPSGKCLKCGICWLYPPGTAPRCETQLDNNNGYRIKYNCSRIGGSCPYTKNDPHFQGAQGTRFESTSPSTESASFPPQSPSAPAPPSFPLFSFPLPAVLPPPPALPHLLPRQQQRLALYLDLLLDWNQQCPVSTRAEAEQRRIADSLSRIPVILAFTRMNLTAVTSRAEAEQRHIADSLSLIPAILALTAPSLPTAPIAASPTPTAPLPTEPLATAPIPTDSPSTVPLPTESPLDSPSATAPPAMPHGALRLVDVGTGAGLPGIVLAVAQPTWQVTLVESLNKRCDFLSHVVQRLGLNNVQVVCGRAEEVGRDPDHREAYDLAVARAVAEMRVLNELCLPLVRVGGAFIAAKGPNPQDEVAAASNSASLLGAQLATTYEAVIYAIAPPLTFLPLSSPHPTTVASSNTNGQRTAVV
ncbi:unnamed protein product [Closterium sp. NIES-65]|nr:unnamed protein product [Closterium sp. NIES-65]